MILVKVTIAHTSHPQSAYVWYSDEQIYIVNIAIGSWKGLEDVARSKFEVNTRLITRENNIP